MSDKNKKEKCMSTIIRITVLGWSAALITACYAGALAMMYPKFIATFFTAAAATFGVYTLKKGDKDDDADKPTRRDPEPEFVIDPVAPVEPTVATEATSGCTNCDPGDNPDYSRSTPVS